MTLGDGTTERYHGEDLFFEADRVGEVTTYSYHGSRCLTMAVGPFGGMPLLLMTLTGSTDDKDDRSAKYVYKAAGKVILAEPLLVSGG